MSAPSQGSLTPTGTIATTVDRRRVFFATVVGTTVEWYDFFIYASAAGLVFGELFFKPAGPAFAQIVAFASVGVSFLFRPLGAFIAGHIGDRYGRRVVLVLTLLLMGVGTTLIGVLPDYSVIGVAAPIILILLRVLQGISSGGEWGGAALMAVEHAPRNKRGFFGAAPQIGVPIGLLLASAMFAIMSAIAPGAAFMQWGWRVPFLFSIVLIGIGYWVRRRVEESPVFVEMAERKERTKQPLLVVFRKHWLLVILAALIFAGNNAAGYMTTGGYIQNYATSPEGPLKMDRGPVLWAVALSSVVWLVFTWLSGWISDRIGRRTTFIIGWVLLFVGAFILFPLVDTGSVVMLGLGLVLFAIALGITYGPLSALYAELFPASIRLSGVSITYAIGAILGGAFAPTIAAALVKETHTTFSVSIYLGIMALLGLLGSLMLRDRSGIPLDSEHEELQAESPIYGVSKA